MALFRRRRMRRETATRQKYIQYFNRMKSAGKLRQALTYSQWLKRPAVRKPRVVISRRRRKPAKKAEKEFTTVRTRAVEKQLRRSGLTEAEIRKLRGKK